MSTEPVGGVEKVPAERRPRVLSITAAGIRSLDDYKRYFAAMMADVVEGLIPAAICNAGCNSGGKLMKAVEVERRYGEGVKGDVRRLLIFDEDKPQANGHGKAKKK